MHTYYKIVREAYARVLRQKGWDFGVIPLLDVYVAALESGHLLDVSFVRFIDIVKTLARMYKDVKLHIHPRFVDKPHIGWAVEVTSVEQFSSY